MNDPVRQQSDVPEERIQVLVEQAAPNVAVLKLVGDVDLLTAGVLHDRLWPHLERANSAVVLDFTKVDFLGSAGLSELVSANETAIKGSVRLFIVASSRSVLRPLEITGLHTLFRVVDTVDEALRQV